MTILLAGLLISIVLIIGFVGIWMFKQGKNSATQDELANEQEVESEAIHISASVDSLSNDAARKQLLDKFCKK